MLSEFMDGQLKKARYKLLEDGTYFGEISRLRGVWASGKTLEKCREELAEVLEDWTLLKVHDNEKIPGFKINFDRKLSVRYA